MDPAAHFSGAYLTSKTYLEQFHPEIDKKERDELIKIGAVCGVIQDFDFLLNKSRSENHDFFPITTPFLHHQWFTHTPAFYLTIFATLELIAKKRRSRKMELLAEIFLVGALTHFFMDSIATDGIAWLYPLSKKRFALGKTEVHGTEYWKKYYSGYPIILELIIVTVNLLFLYKSKKRT